MEPWVLSDSELSKSATHRSKIVLSEARSVKTPSLTQNSLRSAPTLYFVLIKLRTLLFFYSDWPDILCVFVCDNLGNFAGLVCLVLLDVFERRIGDHVVTQDPDGGKWKSVQHFKMFGYLKCISIQCLFTSVIRARQRNLPAKESGRVLCVQISGKTTFAEGVAL